MSEAAVVRGPGRPRKAVQQDYRLVWDTSPSGLEKKVLRLLAEGWQVAGGVAIRGQQWYQALTR